MTSMELRAWIAIDNFPPADDDDAWTPFADALVRRAGHLGAVLAWTGETTGEVVMSDDTTDRARLAEVAVGHVVDALHDAGLADRYPTAIVIEPVPDEEFAAA